MPTITLACSPDADDLFMMKALLDGELDTSPYQFEITQSPTDALNRLASGDDGPDVLAISIAHYPQVADRYQLLPHGGSMGEGYGPVVVAREPMNLEALEGKRVGVPGLTTTAYTTLRLMVEVDPVVTPITPYSLIFEALRDGHIDAGLIIHEGRLTYQDEGFHKVADLGEWWAGETGGLPLPLGGNTIKRALDPKTTREVSALLKRSIEMGLEGREDAIDWLLARGGALGTRERVSEYLHMYANARTVDYGDAGKMGIKAFFERCAGAGLLDRCVVDYAP